MKKLYFLNEEESKRILNLHKDATKKQYLKEDTKQFTIDKASGMPIPGGISQEAYNKIMSYSKQMRLDLKGSLLGPEYQKAINNEFGPNTYDDFWRDNGAAVLSNGGLKASVGSIEAAKAAADKAVSTMTPTGSTTTSTGSTTTPTGSTLTKGPLVTQIQQILKQKGINLGKTGVDGVMGNITLNGIIKALGAETSTPKTPTTATATSTGGGPATTSVGGTSTQTGGGPR